MGSAIAVVAVYAVLNVIVQTIIQPRFTGDAVGISGTVAFISLIFWAYVLGGLGALLAIPATLFLKSMLLDSSQPASWVSALISSSPGKDQPQQPRRRAGRRAASSRPTEAQDERGGLGAATGRRRRRARGAG